MRVTIDLDRCQGHGTCAGEAPEVFAVDDERGKVVLRLETPPDSLRTQVRAAVRYCPTGAIALIDD